MDYFSIIKDSDIFGGGETDSTAYIVRPTAKGVVLDDEGKVALLSNGEHSLFPGGGVDEGETFREAFIRECMEEIGCEVEVLSSLGRALQVRSKSKRKYEVEFFVGKVRGAKGAPTTTQAGELACTIDWLDDTEVITILESQIKDIRPDDYPAQFNCRTHLAVFERYLEISK